MKISHKTKLITANGVMGFWNGFYLTCSNNSCLEMGNSSQLMMALFIALGAAAGGMITGHFLAAFVESTYQEAMDKKNSADEMLENITVDNFGYVQ